MSAVSLEHLVCTFGTMRAADDVTLDIPEGEFYSLLGPSGSGKTTVLRLIGGFETPDSGRVRLFGQDVTQLPPYRRDVNTVFQDYALFPHLSVLDNVAYPLTVRGVSVSERRTRAGEMLELVQLTAFSSRRPSQLSGGQRQRVALARALAARPRLLLLDEPLGALDLKLREQMQSELKGIQRHLGLTFIYVTHDQGEALSMSDRLAVFSAGRIEQEGTPHDLYEYPRTAFVADFVGRANVLPGERLGRPGTRLALRPERVEVLPAGQGSWQASVREVQYLGAQTRLELDAGGVPLQALIASAAGLPAVGDTLGLRWDEAALRVLER
ncbi:ABC transporter ATP-binding protein [Deinococcus sp. KNUC1210]|uniref:ABC transporter ATP-binding protein n=1 Tax=Deinococcus sp. KNUC1210 TaxID=2917691 RepID=UPI00351D2131